MGSRHFAVLVIVGLSFIAQPSWGLDLDIDSIVKQCTQDVQPIIDFASRIISFENTSDVKEMIHITADTCDEVNGDDSEIRAYLKDFDIVSQVEVPMQSEECPISNFVPIIVQMLGMNSFHDVVMSLREILLGVVNSVNVMACTENDGEYCTTLMEKLDDTSRSMVQKGQCSDDAQETLGCCYEVLEDQSANIYAFIQPLLPLLTNPMLAKVLPEDMSNMINSALTDLQATAEACCASAEETDQCEEPEVLSDSLGSASEKGGRQCDGNSTETTETTSQPATTIASTRDPGTQESQDGRSSGSDGSDPGSAESASLCFTVIVAAFAAALYAL